MIIKMPHVLHGSSVFQTGLFVLVFSLPTTFQPLPSKLVSVSHLFAVVWKPRPAQKILTSGRHAVPLPYLGLSALPRQMAKLVQLASELILYFSD